MNQYVRRYYHAFRAKGYRATDALRAARVKDRFEDLENEGLVRLYSEPEMEMHDLSYVDTWGLSPKRTEREKQRIRDMIDRDGLWIWSAQFRTDEDEDWEYVDDATVGDVVGDIEGIYDIDFMELAIEAVESALDADRTREAAGLAERATFAGVQS